MRLNPKDPPGRRSRKALTFASEIGRLNREGYTCEAIREALLEAGVCVGLTTVKREITRHAKCAQPVERRPSVLLESPSRQTPSASPPSSLASDPRTGKEIAAAWVDKQVINPLFRARLAHESRRH